MAFLGGLSGIGALAGGIEQGIGQGFNWDQYLQNAQAQNLAGNILGQYGQDQGAQPVSGLSGGQTLSSGPAGSGDQSGSVSPAPPSMIPSQLPGTAGMNAQLGANPLQSLFTQNQQQLIPTGQAAVGAGLGNQGQSQAQAQASPQGTSTLPPSQFTPPQPFQTNQAQGIGGMGAQNQLSLPQFVQLARRVNPNASGRMIMGAAGALAKGGLLGYGGITPYQMAELQLQIGASEREWANFNRQFQEGQSREAHWTKTEEHQTAVEDRNQAWQRMQVARQTLSEAERALQDVQSDLSRTTDDDQKEALNAQIPDLKKARDRAEKAYNQAEKEYLSAGSGKAAADATGQGEQRARDIANAKRYLQSGADRNKVIETLKTRYPDLDPSELE